MSKVVIIGNGPAGISAALYTIRAGIDTTVIGKDSGALAKTSEIENYYGFIDPISGEELVSRGLEQAKRLGVNLVENEVLSIAYEDSLVVQAKEINYAADCVVIATGTSRATPKIKGVKEFEGHGVSYCAVCDAFFYRGKDVAVLGDGEYALHEALALLSTSKSVTLLTNGSQPQIIVPDQIKVITESIDYFDGNNIIEKVTFKDGSTLDISGLFVAVGVAGSTDLAKKIGAAIENNKIIVDEKMSTNVPGLYAAGDCTGGMLQIAKAVYEGAKAGTEIVKFLRNKK